MYTALSGFYDKLMADVDYDGWTKYLLEALDGNDDGVDLACGTGAVTLRLLAAGKTLFGMDKSESMLAVAADNAVKAGVRALFVRGDMTTFRPTHKLGFVTSVCDGLNYVSRPAAVFESVYAALQPGGVFVFDVSSAYKLRETVGNRTFYYEDDDLTYVWRNRLGKRTVDMELTFFERKGDMYVKSKETQRQYIHETAALASALENAGFLVRVCGDRKFSRPKPHEQRICFIARKEH